MDRAANRAVIVRAGLATLVVAALLAGVWLLPGGASTSTKSKKTYSASDCATLQGITVDSSKGSGYFGKQAEAAADAYVAAANEISDKKLKSALKTLASFYVDLGKADNIAEAAVLTAKGGKAYGKALKVYLKASVYCVSQITIPSFTVPTLPSSSSSSTSTPSSTSSTSSPSSTSTSSPTTTTT